MDPAQILTATQPWFQSHPTRQAFLSRLLALLISAPFPGQQPLCEALLVVEASHVNLDAKSAQHESSTGQLDVDRAREAAKKLLTEQRSNLGLWAAYASLEYKARQYKVAASFVHLPGAQCQPQAFH